MTTNGKSIYREYGSNQGKNDKGCEISPGTIEVTVRIMGEEGGWIERTVQIESGITVGTFDVANRKGYLDSFHTLEQAMITARNEATREATESFLKELEKKRTK